MLPVEEGNFFEGVYMNFYFSKKSQFVLSLRPMVMLVIFFGLFSGPLSFAQSFFKPLRVDPSVPGHCVQPELSDFASASETVFYGITGAVLKGFTHEVALDRKDAATLWNAKLSGVPHPPGLSRDLMAIFDQLTAMAGASGFTYKAEGEVLEALAINQMASDYPLNEYFITGGISYFEPVGGGRFQTLGELDLVVGRRSDCAIVTIGEAKLGVRQINHARSQINRFLVWIKGRICSDRSLPVCQL
jgi:hypothetical protein